MRRVRIVSAGVPARLDREAPLPLYAQLKDALLAEVRDGGLEPGDRFPTEAAIGDRYRVSRATVRQALADLEASGVIRKVQGLGSFVAVPKIRHVPLLTSFGELAASQGFTPSHRVLVSSVVEAARRRCGRARPRRGYALPLPAPALPGRRQDGRSRRDVASGERRSAGTTTSSSATGWTRARCTRSCRREPIGLDARPRGRDDLARRRRRRERRAARLRPGHARAADPARSRSRPSGDPVECDAARVRRRALRVPGRAAPAWRDAR